MKRMLWLGIGLAVGALVVHKVTRRAQAFTPQGIAGAVAGSAQHAVGTVRSFVGDVRAAMAEREAEIHSAFAEGIVMSDAEPAWSEDGQR